MAIQHVDLALSIKNTQTSNAFSREQSGANLNADKVLPINEFHILTFRAGPNDQQLLSAGEIIEQQALSTWDLSNNGNLVLGKERHNDMRYGYKYHGKIAEVIVFNSKLNDADLNNINHYLAKKWGLTATVDSDGDGLTDTEEETIGTNPLDARSRPIGISSNGSDVVLDATNYTLDDGSTVMIFNYDDNNDNGQGQTEYTLNLPVNAVADVLVVAGGGAGGGNGQGGGGGAGGLIYYEGFTIEGNSDVVIKVGDGGDDGTNSANHGDNGNDSSIDANGTSMFVAKGGGGGATWNSSNVRRGQNFLPQAGASGGGGAGDSAGGTLLSGNIVNGQAITINGNDYVLPAGLTGDRGADSLNDTGFLGMWVAESQPLQPMAKAMPWAHGVQVVVVPVRRVKKRKIPQPTIPQGMAVQAKCTRLPETATYYAGGGGGGVRPNTTEFQQTDARMITVGSGGQGGGGAGSGGPGGSQVRMVKMAWMAPAAVVVVLGCISAWWWH